MQLVVWGGHELAAGCAGDLWSDVRGQVDRLRACAGGRGPGRNSRRRRGNGAATVTFALGVTRGQVDCLHICAARGRGSGCNPRRQRCEHATTAAAAAATATAEHTALACKGAWRRAWGGDVVLAVVVFPLVLVLVKIRACAAELAQLALAPAARLAQLASGRLFAVVSARARAVALAPRPAPAALLAAPAAAGGAACVVRVRLAAAALRPRRADRLRGPAAAALHGRLPPSRSQLGARAAPRKSTLACSARRAPALPLAAWRARRPPQEHSRLLCAPSARPAARPALELAS
ncbi:hypothetical protein T492DRAFT_928414 [Pavlovales sp. CCMP2436]|nr:hypothetical protein T492DRAFT_928414 [Pavlovales sp. CCMP2436]